MESNDNISAAGITDEVKTRYVDPLSDDGFKAIFRNEDILTVFLTDLIEPESPITGITYLDKEMLGNVITERKAVYDFRCNTKDGRYFIVEMQRKGQEFFSDRIIYYLSRSFSTQRLKGQKDKKFINGEEEEVEWNYELAPVYGIFFLNYTLKGFEKRSVRTVRLRVDETGEVFSEKLKAFILEVSSFRGKAESVCKTKLDYWLYIMANMATMTQPLPFQAEQPIFKVLQRVAEYDNMTIEDCEKYGMDEDDYLTTKAAWDFNFKEGVMEGKEQGFVEGRKEGIEEGKKEGIEKGKKEGIEKGRNEGKKESRTAIAKAMKAKKYSLQDIADLTGLTIKEIKSL